MVAISINIHPHCDQATAVVVAKSKDDCRVDRVLAIEHDLFNRRIYALTEARAKARTSFALHGVPLGQGTTTCR